MKYEFSKCQRQGVKKQPGLRMITSTEECQPGHEDVVNRQHVCHGVDNLDNLDISGKISLSRKSGEGLGGCRNTIPEAFAEQLG